MKLLVLASLALIAPSLATQDVEAKLQAATTKFEAKHKEARQSLLDELDAAIAAATDDAAAQRARADREAFEAKDLLPASLAKAARKYEDQRRVLATQLWKKLDEIEADCRASAQHEEAAEVEARRAKLAAQHEQFQWSDLRLQAAIDDAGPSWQGASLVFDGEGERTLRLPLRSLEKQDGYRIELELARTSGTKGVKLLFPRADRDLEELGLLILGGVDGRTSGLELVDGKSIDENSTRHEGDVLPSDRASMVALESTDEEVVVEVDGRRILRWTPKAELALPAGLAAKFKKPARDVVILVPADVKARLDVARVLTRPGAVVEAADSQEPPAKAEKPVAPDRLPLGRAFVGTWFDKKDCELEVVERDRAANKVVIRVTGEQRAVFRVEATTTKDDGSAFKIDNVLQRKAAPGTALNRTIDFKRGSGTVAADGKLSMSWSAEMDGPNFKGRDWSSTVKAQAK